MITISSLLGLYWTIRNFTILSILVQERTGYFSFTGNDSEIFENTVSCEQGEKGEGREREKGRETEGEPVGIHQYFDCSSFIIYSGPSINYSNVRNNNNKIY